MQRYRISRAFWKRCYDERISMQQLAEIVGISAGRVRIYRRDEQTRVGESFVRAVTNALIFAHDQDFFIPVECTVRQKGGDEPSDAQRTMSGAARHR